MKDFKQTFETTDLEQRASATVTVNDYSGLSGETVTLDGNVLTEGVDWNAVTDNDTTATNLATALDGVAGYSASASGAVVTVYYDTAGTGGNAKTIATSDATDLTLSGATLAGGVAQTYSDIFKCNEDEEGYDFVSFMAKVSSYSSGNLTITPQVSYNGVDFFDFHDFEDITANGTYDYHIFDPKAHVRLKFVFDGEPVALELIMITQRGECPLNASEDGAKTVTSAGTAEPLSATRKMVRNLDVQAKVGNTDSVYIGGPNVQNGGADGLEAIPLGSRHYSRPIDLAKVWIDADVNGEGVTYTYEY